MRSIFKVASLLLLFIVFSCQRQKLEEKGLDNAKIPISVDWTRSEITPQNVTVLCYDENNGGKLVVEHRYEHNNKPIQSYIYLPVGAYTVVVFNELRDQVDFVGVRGYETLSTLEFYAKEDLSIKTRADRDVYVSQPDLVAVAVVRGYNVTLDAPKPLNGIIPEVKASQLNITIHVKGLNNARMPALIDLRNIAGGYMVDLDKNTTACATTQFMLNNRKYDTNSANDGTISTGSIPINLFGVIGERNSIKDQPDGHNLLLDMLFMLTDNDKTIVNHVIDITNLIKFSSKKTGAIIIDLSISLEKPLPDVNPDGGDSGFGSNLGDWNVIDVPLVSK